MRILHTSHSGLPDPRIEKTALTMKNSGHEVIFLGGTPDRRKHQDTFSETHHVPITNSFRIVMEPSFKRRWLRRIDEIQPDVVHAHNIIAAAMMLDSDYPVVYDDHEYWSKEIFKFASRSLFKRVIAKPLVLAIPKWEKQILEKYPVLTVSENISKEHRMLSRFVGVTRNYPLLEEVVDLTSPQSRTGNAYIGADFSLPKFLPHRDMIGIKDYIDFDILNGLPHYEMMERLTKYKVGLTPWKQHPFHVYCEPNKTYEYLHAGLQVLATDSLSDQFQDVEYVHPFQEYSQIPSIIESLEEHNPMDIMEFARKKYVWENQKELIEEAYRHAL